MASTLKDKMMAKGLQLMQSPMVGKIMENEKVGIALTKAMNVPLKLTASLNAQKERFVTLFDLATQQDMDELRRALSKVEGVLKEIKEESSEMLRKVEDTKKK
jgi:hypothetical protein